VTRVFIDTNILIDLLAIVAAQSIEKIDCIATRNVKDFRRAEIPVLTPDEFVKIHL